ncbi:MAG TPA: hypothetical protein VGB65_02470 [Allosphingosinicella sp.]
MAMARSPRLGRIATEPAMVDDQATGSEPPAFSITFYPPAPGLERAVLYYWLIRGGSPSENFIEPNWPALGWRISGEWRMSFGGRPSVPFPPAWVCGCIDEEANGFSGNAGELRAVKSGGTWFIQADANGDGAADLHIYAVTSNTHVFGAADFVL